MTILLRDQTEVQDRRLDRLVQFDPRSRKFGIAALIEPTKPRSYTWRVDYWLDQGVEGACVGYAWAHELAARPKPLPGITDTIARQIYHEAQRSDPWEGGAYMGASPYYDGTSVLAGAQATRQMGYIGEYRWAFGLDDVRLALGYKGPIILGLNWYEGMMDPDSAGYLEPEGGMVGGHALLAYGNDEKGKRVKLWNSWGSEWGNNGTAYISYDHLDRLLYEQGEACIPVERK